MRYETKHAQVSELDDECRTTAHVRSGKRSRAGLKYI